MQEGLRAPPGTGGSGKALGWCPILCRGMRYSRASRPSFLYGSREQWTLQGIANIRALNLVPRSTKISLFLKEGGGGWKREGKDLENVGKMKREPLSKVMFMSSRLLSSNIPFALFSPDVAVLLPYDVLIHNKQLPKYLLAAKAEQQTLSVYLCI